MNLTSIALVSFAPTAKLVKEGAAQILQSGRDFASHIAEAAVAEKPTEAEQSRGYQKALERLLQPLREYLGSQGYSDYEFELVSDGRDELTVDGDPHLSQAVQNWIDDHPKWKGAWQQEASSKIASDTNEQSGTRAYPWLNLDESSLSRPNATLRYRALPD